MFRLIRETSEAIRGLQLSLIDATQVLSRHVQLLQHDDGVQERLETLERSRALHEAEVEALILSAESKFKAARASEERQRTVARANGGADESDEEGLAILEAYRALIAEGDAGGGGGEELPALQADLAANPEIQKSQAVRMKYGA